MLTGRNAGGSRTLAQVLAEDRDPAARALVGIRPGAAPRVLTWADLRETTGRHAAGLWSRGLRPGDVLVIAHVDPLETVFAFLAALELGAVPSIFPTLTEKLDPAAYRAGIALLVRHAGARLVLTHDRFLPELASLTGCATTCFGELLATAAPPAPGFAASPRSIAFLQHSSGTTGLQKGVALSHEAVLGQVASYSDALGLRGDDVVVSWLPLYHDMGLIAGFLLPLLQGVPLVLLSPFDWVRRPALLLRAIHDHRGTLCWLPNFAYNHCARRVLDRELAGVSLAGMRAFVNCSEPVLDESQRAFLARFSGVGVREEQLAACYAMAENVFAVTQTPLGWPPRLDVRATGAVHVSCGPPIPGVEVRIAAGAPDGQIGEIQIRSPFLLSGYHRRPDLDAGLFEDGFFSTGDLGYLRDGELYVVGRRKDLIITAGRNLHPHDLEAVVNDVPGVHPGRCVAFGVEEAAEGTELVAIVAEVDTDDADERRRIGAAIRQELVARTGVAASWVHLVGPRWLLKTSSGKLARGANRDKWLAERGPA